MLVSPWDNKVDISYHFFHVGYENLIFESKISRFNFHLRLIPRQYLTRLDRTAKVRSRAKHLSGWEAL